MSNIEISIVVPAYKKQKSIVDNLKKLQQIVSTITSDYEIICVVDGVLDDTYKNAKKIESSKIKIVGYERNRGKGSAIRYGLLHAKKKIVVTVDAGTDINPDGLNMMLEHFKWYDADIIVGSKRHSASKVIYPWQRRLMSIGYQLVVRSLFGLNIRDTQVGMKIYRKQVIDKILPRLLVKEYAFDIEMLSVANYLGFKKIYEAPIELRLDFDKTSGIISKGFIRTIFKMLKDTAAVFYRLKIKKYYSDRNMVNWHTDVYPDAL